jgi:hypothetical protein
MTDAEFRDLFTHMEQPVEPRPEFVERLLADVNAVAAPSGAVPDQEASRAHATTDLKGTVPERAYLPEQEAHPMSTIGRARAHRNRIIVALTAAAVIATAVVVVTRSTGSHETGNSPNPASSPSTTVSPVTTAPPVTTEAPARPPSSTSNTLSFPGCQQFYFMPNILTPGRPVPDQVTAHDGQVVHVVLKGCAPGSAYVVAECGGGLGDCLHQSALADATGTVSTSLKVQKVFPSIDCGVAPGCTFGVYLPEGNGLTNEYSYTVLRISFGP